MEQSTTLQAARPVKGSRLVPLALAFHARHRIAFAWIAIILVGVIGLMARRPDQLHAPYIWVEDAGINLPDYARSGWRTIFHTVSGYFVLPSKLLFVVSMVLSFRWFPEVSYWLTALFTCLVMGAVAFSPTRLQLRLACALMLMALPVDSEVYGVSLYACWWGSLLVVLPLLWRDDARHRRGWRTAMLLLGGLSSPIVIALLPLFAWRAWAHRNRDVSMDLGFAALAAAVQLGALLVSEHAPYNGFAHFGLGLFLQKFFGYFVLVHATAAEHYFASGLAAAFLLAGVTAFGWRHRKDLGETFFILLAAVVLAAIASALRNDLAIIHPVNAGPRYFFLPFAFLSWALIQLAALPRAPGQAGFAAAFALAMLALATRDALVIGQRRHEANDWRQVVSNCIAAEGRQPIPFHFDGRRASMGNTYLTGEECRRLVMNSVFDRRIEP